MEIIYLLLPTLPLLLTPILVKKFVFLIYLLFSYNDTTNKSYEKECFEENFKVVYRSKSIRGVRLELYTKK